MRNAAECQAEEIKRRALEEADLIRSSARLNVEGTPGASTMVERNVEIEASMILRFAQTFATEARAEATKVLDDARAEAEQLLSSAWADAGAIPSSCSALVGDKDKLRRERDAIRKRVKYWKSRSTDESHGVEQPGVAERDLGSRTIHFSRPSSWSEKKEFFKGAKARAALDSNQTQRFPAGVRKTRSDKLSGAVIAVVEDLWRSKSRVSPRKDNEIRKRINAPKVYETHQVHWIEETEVLLR
ncbi:hypothetical protein R1sor_025554 [Riccia sorocarpa]|uniref:Uncharacterized protein n=1 Tax=Riccia sorocarpa TaxID=122646 RepID=A0ABD3GAA8_9MARC